MNLNQLKFAIVTSEFNFEITEKLEVGALEFFNSKGFLKDQIKVIRVPGAFEIPVICKQLFLSGYDGVVALGCIIRGETTHYDYVCKGVQEGVLQVQLDFCRPIGFGVLTTENKHQALDRAGGRHGNKGFEAAETTYRIFEMISELK